MLPYADLLTHVRFTQAGQLPGYRGTTLRGALGYALKRVVCHVRQRECERCFLRDRCAYPALFESVPPAERTIMRKYPRVPQPFVLRVAGPAEREVRADSEYEFGIRLFGPAIDFHPYVILALLDIGQRGLGRDHLRYELMSVGDGERVVYDSQAANEIQPPSVRVPPPAPLGRTRVNLRFLTPMRFLTEARLNQDPDLEAFVRSALRRLRVMHYFYGRGDGVPWETGALLQAASTARPLARELRWVEIKRFSTRQNAELALSGFTGHMSFEIDGPDLTALLQHAAVCHVGKATSFGFGRIELEIETL